MPGLPKELTDLLAKYGVDRKSLTKIKFGGVIGKQALVAISGVVGLAFFAFRAESPYLLWGCAVGIFALSISTVIAIGIHGHRHPIEATLEGGEVVIVQHLRTEAAKGMEQIPPSPAVLEGMGHKILKDAKES
jgi:hypothetical protein